MRCTWTPAPCTLTVCIAWHSFVPIVPLVLLNGAEGIGTGWSTHVPSYHPVSIIDAMLTRLGCGDDVEPVPGLDDAASPEALKPWYRGFAGSMVPLPGRGFVSYGNLAWERKRNIRITELPVGRWTDDYKVCRRARRKSRRPRCVFTALRVGLQGMLIKNFVGKGLVQRFQEHTTDQTAEFLLQLSPQGVEHFTPYRHDTDGGAKSPYELHKALKLSRNVLTTNMHLFDPRGEIKKCEPCGWGLVAAGLCVLMRARFHRYTGVEHVLDDFEPIRRALYERRRQWQLAKLEAEALKLGNRARFLDEVLSGRLDLRAMTRSQLESTLMDGGFATAQQLTVTPPVFRASAADETVDGDAVQPAAVAASDRGSQFAYLINTPMWQLTGESMSAAAQRAKKTKEDIATLQGTTASELWASELRALRRVYVASLEG